METYVKGFITYEKYPGTNRRNNTGFPGTSERLLIMIHESSHNCFAVCEWDSRLVK
jgi:hypothetical protein